MCIAVPSRIVEIMDAGLPMARIEVAGRLQECCLGYVPEARVGDHVLVQNGFAVTVLDPESAAESLAAFAELGVLSQPPPTEGRPA